MHVTINHTLNKYKNKIYSSFCISEISANLYVSTNLSVKEAIVSFEKKKENL
jgi:hypothetical protein